MVVDPSAACEFQDALELHAQDFGVRLNAEAVERLREYYELVRAWNARLHLVAPCPPAEFATRHVLESLMASTHIAEGSSVTDVGSGGGLPIIPCLTARTDISATLIESSRKKAVFLREALHVVGAAGRARIVPERFENTPTPETEYVSSRALDRFTDVLPELVEWAGSSKTLLLFGGETLRDEIEKLSLPYKSELAHGSERRYLFVVGLE